MGKSLAATLIIFCLLTGFITGYLVREPEVNQLISKFSSLQTLYESLQLNYSQLQSKYNLLQLNYSSLQSAYHDLQLEYGRIYEQRYEEGYEAGYLQGVIDGAGRGFTIRDPTYNEALQFIAQDQTDKNPYVPGVYVCLNFAADVKNNAFKAGYRCGFVYIEFPENAHATVCFNTTDKGLIFIEPQDDRVVIVDIGIQYWEDNGYKSPGYNDTITEYVIIW